MQHATPSVSLLPSAGPTPLAGLVQEVSPPFTAVGNASAASLPCSPSWHSVLQEQGQHRRSASMTSQAEEAPLSGSGRAGGCCSAAEQALNLRGVHSASPAEPWLHQEAEPASPSLAEVVQPASAHYSSAVLSAGLASLRFEHEGRAHRGARDQLGSDHLCLPTSPSSQHLPATNCGMQQHLPSGQIGSSAMSPRNSTCTGSLRQQVPQAPVPPPPPSMTALGDIVHQSVTGAMRDLR
jgi:hypothetical protein